jgi:hypothetical protein
MKPVDVSRTIRRAVLAALLVTCTLALDTHSASAQIVAFGSPHGPVIGGIAGWVLAKQALFYRALAGMIRAAKSDGFALWGLIGISFVYGIFHAAGRQSGIGRKLCYQCAYMLFYSRSRARGAAGGGQRGENCGGVQQTELYIGVVSVVQSPIEADRTSAVTLSGKKVR